MVRLPLTRLPAYPPTRLHSLMAEPSAAGRTFDAEALPHLDALYRVALRLTGDTSQAEDLVQDTMLKAYRSWRQYRPGTNASTSLSPWIWKPSSPTPWTA